MIKTSHLLNDFPWVAFRGKHNNDIPLGDAFSQGFARLYYVSDHSPCGLKIMDQPQWFIDYKTANNIRTIEISEDQAEELSHCYRTKIQTFEDGIF